MAKNVKAVKQKPASKDAKQVNQKVVAKNGNQQKENEN